MKCIGLIVVAVLAVACGKDNGKGKKAGGGGLTENSTKTAPVQPKQEKAPPPKEAYRGKNRLVNLYVDKDGKTYTVDVWGRRGFEWGPVKLAEKIEFGKASAWFGVPEHMSPAVIPTGGGPDDKEIAPAAYGKADEVVSGLLHASRGSAGVSSLYEVSKEQTAIKPPPAGKGTVILYAYQLSEFDKGLAEKFGGRSFNVGDGTGACRTQRDPKMEALALGGTSTFELDLDPGKHKITLHRWPGPPKKEEACKEAVFELEVEVVADKAQWVFLYTGDGGKTLSTLALPVNE